MSKEQTLTCLGPPEHQWTRPSQRGKPPKYCVNHKPESQNGNQSRVQADTKPAASPGKTNPFIARALAQQASNGDSRQTSVEGSASESAAQDESNLNTDPTWAIDEAVARRANAPVKENPFLALAKKKETAREASVTLDAATAAVVDKPKKDSRTPEQELEQLESEWVSIDDRILAADSKYVKSLKEACAVKDEDQVQEIQKLNKAFDVSDKDQNVLMSLLSRKRFIEKRMEELQPA